MNIEAIREHCLKKKGVTEDFPFDNEVLAFKVLGKVFLLARLNATPMTVNMKCEPAQAIELREKYPAVQPGYHMNKKHWNTVVLDNTVPKKELFSWIDNSYTEVAKGLKKAERATLGL